jgi:formiminoglutamase
MDLTILFSPVDESLYSSVTSASSFFRSIHVFGEKMPEYRGAHLAIFGVGEERGTAANRGTASGPDEIRKGVWQVKQLTKRMSREVATADLVSEVKSILHSTLSSP